MLKKIVLIVIVLFFLLALLGLGKQISGALEAGTRLDRAADELSKLQEENRKLKEDLVWVSSPEFIEEQARNKLNLAKQNETIFLVDQTQIDRVIAASKKVEEVKLPNWQGWIKLFFR